MELNYMRQEDKDLLLRDLCGRLPYGVKLWHESFKDVFILHAIDATQFAVEISNNDSENDDTWWNSIEQVKPYLFPLSSMTEEQYDSLYELGILDNCSHSYEYVNPHIHGVSFIFKQFKTYSLELIEWLNKNHFDYRDLIPMGMAINATGLNIY